MQPNLQRRVQRYGWDRAATEYEALWQAKLAIAQLKLLQCVSLQPGERVLDVACGTGLVAFPAAQAVGPSGRVVGIDLSDRMIDLARGRAKAQEVSNVGFARMDAENMALPSASFDVVLCALGLMYLPDPARAVSEMRRVLHPGGRLGVAVWGERSRCGWAEIFPIVAAEVAGDVCPLFFRLGSQDALARLCADVQFGAIEQHRLETTLHYSNAEEACDAAFVGGPVALAWSRFDDVVRSRVRARYKDTIERWRDGLAYEVPGEFVVLSAVALQ
jgi:ubiquinone/menaquinone biosynthesis C-methylase UbiE